MLDVINKADIIVSTTINLPELDNDKDLHWENVSEDFEGDCGEFVDCLNEDNEIVIYEISNDLKIKDLTDKIRTVVKMFRKSPTKNEILQKRVEEEFKKTLILIIDCKTRWYSTLDMFERFHRLKKSISLTLIDLGGDITISKCEWELLEALIGCLIQLKLL